MPDFNQTAAQEMRSFAHQAVTEGVDLRYLEQMRASALCAPESIAICPHTVAGPHG